MQDCPYLQDCAYDHFKPYRHGGSRRILDNRKTLHTARMNWQQKITTSRPIPPISDQVRGIVIAKTVSYSIGGLEAELTLSPGMLDDEIVADEDIETDSDESGGTGQEYPYEED